MRWHSHKDPAGFIGENAAVFASIPGHVDDLFKRYPHIFTAKEDSVTETPAMQDDLQTRPSHTPVPDNNFQALDSASAEESQFTALPILFDAKEQTHVVMTALSSSIGGKVAARTNLKFLSERTKRRRKSLNALSSRGI